MALSKWAPILKQLATADVAEDLFVCEADTVAVIEKVDIRTDKDTYLFFGPDTVPVTAATSFLLKGGEGYAESGIMVSERIRFVNVVPGERPTVRGILWGR